jgi:hypothetical protein
LRSLRSLAREKEVGRTVVALPIAVVLPSFKAEDMWTKWSGESSFSKVGKLANLAPTSSTSEFSLGRYGCLLVLRGVRGQGRGRGGRDGGVART